MRENNVELQRCVRLAVNLIDLPDMRALVKCVSCLEYHHGARGEAVALRCATWMTPSTADAAAS